MLSEFWRAVEDFIKEERTQDAVDVTTENDSNGNKMQVRIIFPTTQQNRKAENTAKPEIEVLDLNALPIVFDGTNEAEAIEKKEAAVEHLTLALSKTLQTISYKPLS